MNIVNKAALLCGICAVIVANSGCASMFSSNHQKLRITSTTPGATIFYLEDSVGTGKAKVRVQKSHIFESVVVEKKGFQTKSYPFQVGPLSPTAAFAVLDVATFFAIFFVLPIDLSTPKVHKYKKNQTVPALTPLNNRLPDEKFLLVENTSFNTHANDVRFKTYKSIKGYNHKSLSTSKKKNTKKLGKDGLEITNTIFTDVLNDKLQDMGFIDTTRKLFTNANNTLYLDATIKKVTLHRIGLIKKSFQQKNSHQLVSMQLEIEWKVLDYYKQPVYTTHTEKVSDLFLVEFAEPFSSKEEASSDDYGFSKPIKRAIANNFEQSLTDVRAEISKKGLLTISAKGQEDTSAVTLLSKPVPLGDSVRLNEMLKSSVSIKVDDGHGSGVIVSEDGYIVTNYHVVAGSKNIEIIFSDDTRANAKVVKVSTTADLALLKVEKTALRAFPLLATKDPEIGIDVWAIGTPKSLELGQSLSKGIISGLRNANDISYIQTDVKISPGNSGGALINRKGEVLGIISSKLMGFGTEGVGFAISSYQLFDKLKIRYK